MAKKYHNLAGWLRDVMACLEADDDEYAGELFTMLARIVIDYAPDWLDVTDADLPDADDDAGGQSSAGLGARDGGSSPPLAGPASGHDTMRVPPVDGQATVAGAMVSAARAAALARAGARGTAGSLVRTGRLVGSGQLCDLNGKPVT